MSTAYPLAVVAAELGCGTKDLERRCNGAMIRDEAGLRCIPAHIVRQLIDARDAQLAAEREDRRLARERFRHNPARDRVRAIQAAQADLELGSGLSFQQSALARVTGVELTERVESSSERLDEFLAGETIYHRLGPEPRER
ncbi:hypothetical protein ABW17_12085 [Mycobacterium nebraskense]|uniref:hypothetical protein n=1 Tax=Mycobacterium nebraskense TaxID=244292 RepID=UPI0006419EF4|nr:hypothetical protein [Mycobacterium nebraskense]KLO42377.1 hypothetical protein ABW17_12085 [Mycobacterium nebraskense]